VYELTQYVTYRSTRLRSRRLAGWVWCYVRSARDEGRTDINEPPHINQSVETVGWGYGSWLLATSSRMNGRRQHLHRRWSIIRSSKHAVRWRENDHRRTNYRNIDLSHTATSNPARDFTKLYIVVASGHAAQMRHILCHLSPWACHATAYNMRRGEVRRIKSL